MTSVPTIRLDHLNETEKRAYVIADNRLAELAGWDRALLRIELGELVEIDLKGELSFDIGVIGFEMAEVNIILDEGSEPGALAAADATLQAAEVGPAVTQLGDLWTLGQHKILCADALEANSYTRLMGGARARLCFCDSPYNVPVHGHVSGLGKVQHREFAKGRRIGIPHARGRWCPVREVLAWIEAAEIEKGSLFRSLRKGGAISADRLSGEAVSALIKRHVGRIGLDPMKSSGHSLRAGFVTSAARAGIATHHIRQQTGHASDVTMGRYIREGSLFLGNAAGQLL